MQEVKIDGNESAKLKKKAGYLALATALLLAISKLIVGLASGSISVLASALDSFLDTISSAINLLAITTAIRPADQKHRFGYGKAEALAGFVQSIIITVSALGIIYASIRKFFESSDEKPEDVTAIAVMIFSMVMTLLLVQYQKHVIRKTESLAVSADHLHYLSDILGNGVVIISLLLVRFTGFVLFDVIGGIAIALYILKSSWGILTTSVNILMDRDISEKYRDIIQEILPRYSPGVVGYHDLRTRSSGQIDHIEFHLEMLPDISLAKSHEMVENIAHNIRQVHQNTEIIVHSDPVYINKKGEKILLDRESPRFY